MIRRISAGVALGLAAAVGAGILFVSTAGAQQPAPRGPFRERCAAVLPRQAVEAILVNHRERLRTTRERVITEERTLHSLLIADAATRAALDFQLAKTSEARNAYRRARLDALWDLRSVIPAQDRELAFRCVQRLLLRVR